MSEPKREDYKTAVEYQAALVRYGWKTGEGIKLPDASGIARHKDDGHTHKEDK